MDFKYKVGDKVVFINVGDLNGAHRKARAEFGSSYTVTLCEKLNFKTADGHVGRLYRVEGEPSLLGYFYVLEDELKFDPKYLLQK